MIVISLLSLFSFTVVTVSVVGAPAVNGSEVVLTCTPAEGSQPDLYSWYREPDNASSTGSGSGNGLDLLRPFELVSSGQNLTFSPIVFGDEGVYRCGATAFFPEFLSDPYTLYSKNIYNSS